MTALPPDPPPTASTSPKRSWPLFTVAALAFLPFLGVLFGAAGLTWGLLSSRPRALRAALIAGGGALLNLVGILGLTYYVSTRHSETYDRIAVTRTQQDLATLVGHLEAYHEENAAYPPSLSALQRRPAVLRTINIYDQMGGILSPRAYRYELSRDGRTYDLYSVGADGEAGTPDDVRPVLPDSLAARTGYRPDTSRGG
jgi:hypothetical protein